MCRTKIILGIKEIIFNFSFKLISAFLICSRFSCVFFMLVPQWNYFFPRYRFEIFVKIITLEKLKNSTKFNPVTCRKHLLVGLLDREMWTWFLPLLFPRLEKLSFEKWKINEVLIETSIWTSKSNSAHRLSQLLAFRFSNCEIRWRFHPSPFRSVNLLIKI